MKKLLFILLFTVLTACGSNNVNTPTLTHAAPAETSTTQAPETETAIPATEKVAPEKVVINGREAVQKGDSYFDTNPNNNRTTEVAKIVDGKIEKADFLNQPIPTCGDLQAKMKENQANNKDLLNGVEKWDISQVEGDGVNIPDVILNVLVNDEKPFSKDVLTGQKLDSRDYTIMGTDISLYEIIWDRDVQNIMDKNPGKRPYEQLGCVAVDTVTDVTTVDANGVASTEKVKETQIAVITKWLNPDKSQVVVVTYFPPEYFATVDPEGLVFNRRATGVDIESPRKFLSKIEGDPTKYKILEKWNSTNIVPPEVETNGGFWGNGSEGNLH